MKIQLKTSHILLYSCCLWQILLSHNANGQNYTTRTQRTPYKTAVFETVRAYQHLGYSSHCCARQIILIRPQYCAVCKTDPLPTYPSHILVCLFAEIQFWGLIPTQISQFCLQPHFKFYGAASNFEVLSFLVLTNHKTMPVCLFRLLRLHLLIFDGRCSQGIHQHTVENARKHARSETRITVMTTFSYFFITMLLWLLLLLSHVCIIVCCLHSCLSPQCLFSWSMVNLQ
jgi:hypothetical protein